LRNFAQKNPAADAHFRAPAAGWRLKNTKPAIRSVLAVYSHGFHAVKAAVAMLAFPFRAVHAKAATRTFATIPAAMAAAARAAALRAFRVAFWAFALVAAAI